MYRVLIHGITNSIGGTESVIMNYYRKLNGSKIHFDFLCNQKTAFEKEIVKNGSKIYYLTSKSHHPVQYTKKINNFFRTYGKKYDCIWANESGLANIDYLKLAKKYGIKRRIIQSHTTSNLYTGWSKSIKTFLHEKHKNEITNYATDFWAVSKEAGRWLYPKRISSQVQIIKNGIDVNSFAFDVQKRKEIRKKYNFDNNYVIGLVGRLSPEKNQIFMLDVMKKLTTPNVKMVVVGDGPDKEKIIEKARQLNISDKVLLVGIQHNMQAWYSSFDCYVLPSYFEGFSVSGLEAQANGLPILVSNGAKPKDLKVNNNFYSLGLKQSIEEWCQQIEFIKENENRLDKETIIKNFDNVGLNLDEGYKKIGHLLLN